MVQQTRAELIEHLREQMNFLRRTAQAFDGGEEPEYKRLAVILRVLLHNSKYSKSLLKQLGVQHQIQFLDTRDRPEPAKPRVKTRRWDGGLAVIEMGQGRAHFKAPLEGGLSAKMFGPSPFWQWWRREVLRDTHQQSFSREEFVLFAAHKVGGAHVDPEIPPAMVKLTRFNSVGWGWHLEDGRVVVTVPAGPGDTPMGNPIPTNIRQITFEVQRTIEEQLRELLA